MDTSKKKQSDLLNNPKFKKFILKLISISKASRKMSLADGRKLSTQFFLPEDTVYEPVYKVENIEIFGKSQNIIPLRIYIPNESKDLPVMMYFHRGGWVFGNIEEADPVCRKLSNYLKCIVVSVDYRLAPENPFPKPLDDCYDASIWMAENAKNFGGNSDNLIICGESAGGNLAAAVALLARDRKGPKISAQILIYPAISSSINEAAFEASVDRYFLTKEAMKAFWGMYLQSEEDYNNPYASPNLATNFNDLPRALMITAEYDPLLKEAEDYANMLKKSGVPVIYKCFSEVIHGFLDLPIYEENEKVRWIKEIGKFLKDLQAIK